MLDGLRIDPRQFQSRAGRRVRVYGLPQREHSLLCSLRTLTNFVCRGSRPLLPSIPLLPFKFAVRRTPQIVRRSLALFAPFDWKCSTNIFSVVTCVRSNARPRTAPFARSNSHAPLGLFAPFAPFVSGRPRGRHAPFALFASIAPYERLQVAGVWVHALIPQRPPPLR